MTDAVKVALIAGTPVAIGAVGGLVAAAVKAIADIKAILGHVNSERTALLTENRMLREQLVAQQSAAGLLAQAKATRDGSTEASAT